MSRGLKEKAVDYLFNFSQKRPLMFFVTSFVVRGVMGVCQHMVRAPTAQTRRNLTNVQ